MGLHRFRKGRKSLPPGDGEGAVGKHLGHVFYVLSGFDWGLGMVHRVPLFVMQKKLLGIPSLKKVHKRKPILFG